MKKIFAILSILAILISCDTEIPRLEKDGGSEGVSSTVPLSDAASIYMKCEVSFDGEPSKGNEVYYEIGISLNNLIGNKNEFYVKLDENTAKVIHTRNPDSVYLIKSFVVEAMYLPTTIVYSHSYPFMGDKLENEFVIDRANLNVTKTSTLLMADPIQVVEIMKKHGTCKVVKVDDRKI